MPRKSPIIEFVALSEQAQLPFYASDGAAGADVRCIERLSIAPGEIAAARTGLGCRIPEEYEIQVRPRSGLALKNGVTVINSPGTIDSDYQGELIVLLVNMGKETFSCDPGTRIAQIVASPVSQAKFRWRTAASEGDSGEFKPTERGARGFGSTGIS